MANASIDCEIEPTEPAGPEFMLERANEHIAKLTQELQDLNGELLLVQNKMIYYKTSLRNILDL